MTALLAPLAAAAALLLAPVAASAGKDSPATLYTLHCSGCHLGNGSGLRQGGIPPFQGILGHHLAHPDGRRFLVNVPGVSGSGLGDPEIAAVLNWIIATWGTAEKPKDAPDFTAGEVAALRRQPVDDIAALRQRIDADLRKIGVDISY